MAKTVDLCMAIGPKRLNVDAVRLELLNNTRKEGTAAKKELEKTVMNWDEKPKFEALVGLTHNDVTLIVGPSSPTKLVERWNWINEGTDPYTIRAKRAPYLNFRIGYNSGSRPDTLDTRRGYYIGNYWRRKRSVRHPGIKARGWTGIVTKRQMPKFIKSTNKALRDGMAKGGWDE